MKSSDLLVEIGTEELPPKAMADLALAFESQVCDQLDEQSLGYASCQRFATPRRLALLIRQLQHAQPDREKVRLGPAVNVAFDEEGKPTAAAHGFARSCGVSVSALGRSNKGGVEKLSHLSLEEGTATAGLIPQIVNHALAGLPVPRPMRWGSNRTEFVRPVHWIVLLFGEERVSGQVLGLEAGRSTYGHRFHCSEPIALCSASDYESTLKEQGRVIASFEKRRACILEQVEAAGRAAGGAAHIDHSLLEEVTALVEYPVVHTGKFDPEFLQVPKEAIVLTIQLHQKCFTVVDEGNELLPKFITVSNLLSRDPAQVIKGNERVVRPRLTDARFFFETDKITRLQDRYPQLEQLTFEERLGTVKDKCERIQKLVVSLASVTEAASPACCARAAQLSKCDLLTSMVGEFPDLQGVMGRYYAQHDGEELEVARAIEEHYRPRFAGDEVPESIAGSLLAIADRLDSITGLVGIGLAPTGSKDPFSLRRAAIGVLRIMIEKGLPLDLRNCIDYSVSNYQHVKLESTTAESVFEFMLDRLRAWYGERGISPEVFQSVFELRPSQPLDFHHRVEAVSRFNALPQARTLAAAYKRVTNLLSRESGNLTEVEVNTLLLQEAAETELYHLLQTMEVEVKPLFTRGDYTTGLQKLAAMKDPVDRFFDEVLVMTDDMPQRKNRLAILQRLQGLFGYTANIAQLHIG